MHPPPGIADEEEQRYDDSWHALMPEYGIIVI